MTRFETSNRVLLLAQCFVFLQDMLRRPACSKGADMIMICLKKIMLQTTLKIDLRGIDMILQTMTLFLNLMYFIFTY